MQLLTPHDIKHTKEESAQETQKRMQSIAREESRLVRELNSARSAAEEEKVKITNDLQGFIEKMNEKRTALTREIGSLTETRRELMKPINEVRDEANRMLNEAKQQQILVEQEKFNVKQKEEELLNALEELRDKNSELDQWENDLKRQVLAQNSEKERLSESQKKLADSWLEYHKTVHENNKKLEEREQKIIVAESTFPTKRAELDAQAKAQNARERQLRDKYATLQRTENELKNGNRS